MAGPFLAFRNCNIKPFTHVAKNTLVIYAQKP